METLISILVGFVTVWLMFPRRKKPMESNPVYHKKFWREHREETSEDRFEYPGPMPM